MRYIAVLRTACAVLAACLLPFVAHGQTALVYCPVDIDDVGCRNISAALEGKYPGGIHVGYDGTAGTVDLRVADLSGYWVFMVPSLADDANLKPYALLRDATVASRLRSALTGRIAMWSGTPDLGSADSPNRTLKNVLIANLATWARGNYATAKGPGLVTFLDNSQVASERYDWVTALTGLEVVGDPELASYSTVKSLTPTAQAILTNGNNLLAYANMASFGFEVPDGAAGVSLDAIGQTGTTLIGEIVLLTSPGRTTAAAVVKTDKTHYAPGTTVVITGSGWLPGETVSLKLHEELPLHPDRTFTTVADANGGIDFREFAPEAHAAEVRFVVTATGATSGRQSQTTFTEGTSFTASTTNHNGAGADGLTLLKPGGVVSGDVMLAQVTFSGGEGITVTPPTGWTLVRRENSGSNLSQAIYSKVASPSEPLSYVWGFSASTQAAGAIVRYNNVSVAPGGNPVAAHAASSGTSNTLVAPSVSTTGNTMVVTFFAMGANTRLSAPLSMTERHQVPNPEGSAGPTIMASDVLNSATETGSHTSTSPASGAWVAQTIALEWHEIGQGAGGRLELPIRRPAGVVPGDVLLANIAYAAGGSINQVPLVVTAPAGWTLITRSVNRAPLTQVTYWKVAGASDPLDVWTFNLEVKSVGVITAYGNVDPDNPIDAFAANPPTSRNLASTTDLTALPITTTTPRALVLALYALNANTQVTTPPPGMMLRYSLGAHDPAASNGVTVAAADVVQANAGSTGEKVAKSAVLVIPVAQTIALRPRPLPVKLAFTTDSHTGLVNECLGPVTVQLQDALGRPARAASATTLSLATDGSGGFFTASGCSASAGTTITVKAGANAASFYYRATARGSGAHRLEASAAGLTSASQVQTIDVSVSPTTVGSVAASASTFGGTTDLSAVVSPAVAGSVTFFVGGSVTPISASYNASTGVATASGITHGLNASASAYSVQAVFASADGAYEGSQATNAAALQVDQASQTLSFDLGGVTAKYGDAPFTVAPLATGGASGNPVTFSTETPGACAVTVAGEVTVTAAGLCTLSAGQAGNTNYTAAVSLSRSFTIATRPLTVTAAGVSKVYDGTATTTVVLADDRIAGDALTTGYLSAAFADKNVGTAKAISVSGIAVSGAAAGNYTANATATAFADITARSLTVTATGADKEYDAMSTATVTLADDRLSGDVFSASYANAAFADGNVGTGKSITVDGITISGTDAGNYVVNPTATASGTIRARAVTGTIAAADKVYDGSTAAVATGQSLTGLVAGDQVTLTVADATFDDRNVGAKSVTATIALAGPAATNYALTATTATASAAITPKALTGSFTASSRIYDGTTAATVATSSLPGVVAGDVVSLEVANPVFDTRNAGTAKPVTAALSLAGTGAGNYTVNPTATSLADITARPLVLTATGDDKTYDAGTDATVTLSDNRLGGDALTAGYTGASFADKHVGVAKSITVAGITISGPDAGNYAAASTASASASITPRALMISASAADKVYDGSVAASATLSDDRLAGDAVSTSYAVASFNDPSVSLGKPVTVSGISVTGADAGNYSFNATATTSASITALALTGGIVADDKIYDGSTAAVANGQPLSGLVAGDAVALSVGSAHFDSRNVGSRTVTADISLTGAAAGNYVLSASTAAATASITARPLMGSFTAASKTYDGTTAATVATTALPGVIGQDAVSLEVRNATFDSKDAGTAKTVTASLALSGADIGNYTVNATATSTASIAARTLTVSATGETKVYDGTRSAVATLSDDRVAGDILASAYTSASFADANAGPGKPVTVDGISLSGADAANYVFNTTAGTSADISARPIAVTADPQSKIYGDPDPELTYQVTSGSLVAGERFTGSLARAAGETVAGSPYAIQQGTLTAGPNYLLTVSGAKLAVSPRPVAATIVARSKVYDGDRVATIAGSTLENAIAEDEVGVVVGTAAFADENVGTAKVVTATGLTLVGSHAANYAMSSSTAVATADITARPLTVTAVGHDKTYDGTIAATVTLADDRITGDILTTGHSTASFADKNVGAAKSIVVNGITVTGSDAGNYAFNETAATTASITPRPLVVTATGIDKVYDGATSAAVTLSDNRLAGDVLTAGYSTATFADASAGTGKTIAVSGISLAGNDAGNYAANTATSATATISPRSIAVSADAKSKVYGDPDPALSYQVTSGSLVDGDGFAGELSRAPGETVAGGPYAIQQGTLSAGTNYQLAFSGAALAVTRRAVSATIAVDNKVYDGSVIATISGSTIAGAIAGDAVGVSAGSATFADRNVGSGKAATVTGLTLVGAQAENYALSSSMAVATADITARPLAVTASAQNKVYDGNTIASVALADDRIPGDALTTLFGGALFSDKNVGSAKTVTVSGISLGGADQGNYTFNTTATTTADITARPLIISATAMNKVYDGTTTATVTLADNRLSGDALTAAYSSASFADPNAGTGKVVRVNGITVTGADAANYAFSTATTTTADITPASAVITLGNLSQRWDGTAKTATAATTPTGLAVTLTYTQNGMPAATPTNAGFYDVLATISDPNYRGTATGSLVILNLVDIMPGNSLNIISIGDTKTTEIAAAILGTATFDARTVVPGSVTLGDGIGDDAPVNTSSTGALRASINDVNADGRADLVVYFKKSTVMTMGNVTTATKELIVRGARSDGSRIQGADKVTVYP